MKRISPGKLICGIITIILTLSCLLMIAIGISEIRDSASVPSYYLDEEDYISTLQQEDYMNIYDMTCRDCIPDKKLSSNIKACQAVARYYQAATLYKAYVLTGDNLAITRQVQQMEQYAAQTGNYSDYVETGTGFSSHGRNCHQLNQRKELENFPVAVIRRKFRFDPGSVVYGKV